MNVGIIVQARCGSSRLPGKVLLKIGKISLLEHVIKRLKKIRNKKKIIIATTKKKIDKKIINLAKKNKCSTFAGSEKNVLNRYFLAAKKYKINTIVRICADSPFIDPLIIERGLKIFRKNKYDYVSNIINPTYPAGMSVEIFNFKSLEICNKSKTDQIEKEHVTPFIYRNKNIFKIKNFKNKTNLTKYRFCIDYKKDLLAARKLNDEITKANLKNFSYKKLITIVNKNLSIKKINSKLKTSLRY